MFMRMLSICGTIMMIGCGSQADEGILKIPPPRKVVGKPNKPSSSKGKASRKAAEEPSLDK